MNDYSVGVGGEFFCQNEDFAKKEGRGIGHAKKSVSFFLFFLVFCLFSDAFANLRIAGSSTVYPFIVDLSSVLVDRDKDFKNPIVESIGTGGGFNSFCQNLKGGSKVYVVMASRQITGEEIEMCKKNGIYDAVKMIIGYDGIVLAYSLKSRFFAGDNAIDFSSKDLFNLLSEYVLDKNGNIVKNQTQTYKDVREDLPKQDILFYGPSRTSGTFDAFVEYAVKNFCKNLPQFQNLDDKKKCGVIRHDSKFLEIGENDSIAVRKIGIKKNAIGVFGISYLLENKDIIGAMKVNSVYPTIDSISKKAYPLSRELYLYYDGQEYKKNLELKKFIDFTKEMSFKKVSEDEMKIINLVH